MAKALRKFQEEETRSYRERIRELVEQDYVGAARKLLAEALEKEDHEEDLSGWQQVLAPAKILRVGGERDIDRTPDFQWLKDHGLRSTPNILRTSFQSHDCWTSRR